MRKIRVATATLAVMIALTFASCGNNSTKTEVENRPQQEVKETKEYSKELASFFNSEKESVNNYAGLGEFGFISKVDDTKISEEKMEIFITNTYLDMSVSESGKSEEDLTKKCVYTIDNNQVIEKKIGDDEQVSLIEELIILKAGAEEGSEWIQDVVIEGSTHSVKTTVVKIAGDSEGRKFISTEVEVDGVKGYSDDEKYTEKRTYTEGVGITNFSVNYLGFGDEIFEFSYSIVVFDKE